MPLVYFDASAFVKLLIEESDSELAAVVWDSCDAAISSRLAYPEVRAALASANRGRDIVSTFVDHVPCAVIAWLLDRPIDNPVQLYHWAEELCDQAMEMHPGSTGTYGDLCPPFAQYVHSRVEERLGEPESTWPTDGLTHLLTATVDGERFSPTYLETQIIFLLGASSETSRSLIGALLYELASDRAFYEPHVCPGAALARLEAQVSINAFLDHFTSAEIVPGGFVPIRNAMFHGPKSLRLHLVPRDRGPQERRPATGA